MAGMLESLVGTLGGDTLGQLAGAIGGNNDATGKAVTAALPALLGGLFNNTREPSGAEALLGALGKHDGSILDNLGGLLGGSNDDDGNKILGHLLGERQPQVASQVAKSSGLDMGSVMKLLPKLAPLVMGFLGRRQRSDGLDAGGLASLLGAEKQEVEKDKGMGGIMGMLDRDGDGSIMDDLGDLFGGGGDNDGGGGGAAGLLGKLMGK